MKKLSMLVKRFLRSIKRFSIRNFVKKKYIPVYIVACVIFFFLTGIFVFDMIVNRKKLDPIGNAQRIENPEVVDASKVNKEISPEYPTITSVKDGIGNVNYSSFGQGNMDYWKNPSIKVEDTLKISVVTNNPKGSELSYRYEYQVPGGTFQVLKDWNTTNSLDFVVPANAVGRWLYIKVSVRDADKKYRFNDCDDYTTLIYEVNPKDVKNKIYPIITDSRDDKGNVNTNSWGANEGGSWPDGLPKSLKAGDTVVFTTTAVDPNDDKLEYRFQIQPQGGSFTILKDWSNENTYTWTVPTNYVGTSVYIMVSVRDNDQYLLFNDSGDDYNYMIYTIK